MLVQGQFWQPKTLKKLREKLTQITILLQINPKSATVGLLVVVKIRWKHVVARHWSYGGRQTTGTNGENLANLKFRSNDNGNLRLMAKGSWRLTAQRCASSKVAWWRWLERSRGKERTTTTVISRGRRRKEF